MFSKKEAKGSWEWEISASNSYWGLNLKELWQYRHLGSSLVRRDFLLNYQQTVLGPAWILVQPLLTLVVYVLVFGRMVRISTGDVPPVLFYFSGIVLWNFFSDSFGGTSNTFRENVHIFSKVYFPRLVMPFSIICTQLLRFLIQLLLFFVLIAYYALFQDFSFTWSLEILYFPVAVIAVGLIGLSMGLLFSVLTAKYRDMGTIVSIGLRLLMFVTPVLYPLETVPENFRWIVQANPLSPFFELFRHSLLGAGYVDLYPLLYSTAFLTVALIFSTLLFNKQGDKLIDVV